MTSHARSGRISLAFALVSLLVSLGTANAAPDAVTTVAEARSPHYKSAADAQPVKLRGVVTAFPGWGNSFFLQDETGGIAVDPREATAVRIGDEVEVTGTAHTGRLAPVIVTGNAKVVGTQKLPPAMSAAYADLYRGRLDGQWIEVAGVIQTASLSEASGRQVLRLGLYTSGGAITVQVLHFSGRNFDRLVDSSVRVRGVCGTLINERQQITGVRLFATALSDVHVERPGNAPFSLPVSPLDSLMKFDPSISRDRRVLVHGTVALQIPGEELFIQDGRAAARIQTASQDLFVPGSTVEAAGFLTNNLNSLNLRNAVVRTINAGPTPRPIAVQSSDLVVAKDGFALAPYDGMLVQLDAEVVEHLGRPPSDVWLLRNGPTVFQAEMHASTKATPIVLDAGSQVRVTGICIAEFDRTRSARSFHLVMGSPSSVTLLHKPFWTLSHLTELSLFLFLVCGGLLIVALRRRAGPIDLAWEHSAPVLFAGDFRRISQGLGALSGVTGTVALTGWIFHIGFLQSIWPGISPVKPDSALALVAGGIATWLDAQREHKRIGLQRVCAGVVAAVGGVTLLEWAANWSFGTALLLDTNRMAPVTAMAISVIGCALWLSRRDHFLKVAQTLATGTGIVCLLNLLAYLCGIQNFHGLGAYSAVPVTTSLCLLALNIGLLFSRADHGLMRTISSSAPGGLMARRLLPAVLMLPILLRWIRFEGQTRGLFLDNALWLGVFVSIGMIFLAVLIWRTAIALNRIEDARSRVSWELKTPEQVLRVKEDELRQALGRGFVFDWTWILTTDEVFAHKTVWHLYGSPERSGTGTGAWFRERIHPEDAALYSANTHDALEGSGALDCEYRVIWPDGSIHWLAMRGVVVRDDNGNPVQVHGVNVDVTERKEAELAVLESQQRYLELADAMPQIVWTARPDGVVEYYNQRWYDYTKSSPEQMRTVQFGDWIHADEIECVKEKWKECIASGTAFEAEFRLKRAHDGVYRWYLARAVPVRDAQNEIYRWFGTATEIEDYKRAEALNKSLQKHVQDRSAKLAESEQKLRLLVDGVKDYAIYMLDRDGKIATWNAGAERIKGYSSAEVIGKHFSIFHSAEEVTDGSARRELDTAVRDGRYQKEGLLFRKDGVPFWASTSITAVYGSDGQLKGFSKITRDVTEIKRAAEIAAAALERAEEANRSKTEFLATMSHEIRTPMNAILGMADLLWETDLNAEQRPYVETFRRAGGKLLRLINDILDLSKIEAGQLELEHAAFDLEALAEEAIELLRSKSDAKSLKLSLELDPNVNCWIVGDSTRLRQVLLNLLGNAIKFTDAGEVRLAIGFASSERSELIFSVSDTGIGIPAGKLDTIFENFTQADSSTTRKYGGTGLGLGICKKIVEQMQGRVGVESELEKGSTFRFWIPFEPAREGEPAWQAGVHDFHGHQVLLASKDSPERMVVRDALINWGFVCEEVADSSQALKALNEPGSNRYSLVVLMSPPSASRTIEHGVEMRQTHENLPVLILATDFDPADSRNCREAGLVCAIKTTERPELFRLVSRALRGSQPLPAVTPAETEARTPDEPLRILVAEDYLDNRLLMQAYLKASPHQVKFVENGKAAVELLETEGFDLVFMDIQMPVMDGLTATAAIRERERQRRAAPTPIVALTANARKEDVERSKEVGCTAHLSKPVSKQKLLEAIRQHGHRQMPSEPEVIRIEVNPDLEDLVPGYLDARKRQVPEMMAMLAASNFDQLRSLAHNMKGTGASYGFPELTEVGGALERCAKASDAAGASEQLSRLGEYLSKVELVLQPQ